MKLRRKDVPEVVSVPGQGSAAPVLVPVQRPAGWRQLGDLLVERSVVTHGQLNEALLQQGASGKRLGSLLVEVGALDEMDLVDALAEQFDLAVADLGEHAPEADAVAKLPESVARAHTCVPLEVDEGHLVVAVADPSTQLEQQLAAAAGMPVAMVLASPADIRRAVDTSYRSLTGIDEFVAAFQKTNTTRRAAALTSESAQDDAPVVQVVNKIITQALRDRASDVHIEPQDSRLRIRFRIDGALHDVLALPDAMGPALTSRLKIMAGMNIVERRRPQDGQISMEVDGRSVDIRVATTGVVWGEKVVLRILDKSRPLYKLKDLGMPEDTHATFSKLVHAPFGMVLCAGPTGSGKTTTLYATMSEINESQRNIMTIEDPVEYVFPSINQISTNEQAGLTFATGLKSILR
ncbi:MAG TPA: ATPase, T2SS/T4P/T4SS family, partial [Mycobacteriales bacterium]|nr:ATPase, T2SS/T4P/T4SS family [Mycobacteriales bacterium]